MTRRTLRRPAGTLLTLAVLGPVALGLAGPAAATASPEPTQGEAGEGAVVTDLEPDDESETPMADYDGNAASESALVADEEERLAQVRTVASMIRWRSVDVSGPYRLSTGSTYTLVLTKRDQPYGLADLLELAPQTFVREPDGAYLLTENIVVQPGAKLDLSAAGPLTIRMASDAARFVSIVNMGGELSTRGTSAAPVTVTSWDRDGGAPDTLTDDGRAYVRSIGGVVELEGTRFSDLGFWSGRTGGVALTGTDLPSEGALDKYGRELEAAVKTGTAAGDQAVGDETVDGAAGEGTGTAEDPSLEGVLPAGVLPVPENDGEDPSYSYVSARIEDSTFTRNAFGLFVSNANGIDIKGTEVEDSLVDGIVLHRFVVNAAITGTTSTGNVGDGFALARATTGIMLTEVTSSDNGGSGIFVRGTPLADGPNASGMPVGDYGNNTIANSTTEDNARYGIEVVGGRNVNVNANDVNGNDMGIVVRDDARDVSLVGNRLEGNVRHGIAIRDGVSAATVSGNVITDGPNGVYLRDSSAVVERNTMSGLTNHAITVVGAAEGTVLAENTMAGRGPSAIDVKRAEGEVRRANDTAGWESTKPFWTVVRNAMQPLTVMWVLLGLVVLVTAVKGSRRRNERRHPYEAQRRMAELVQPPVMLMDQTVAPQHEARPEPEVRTAPAHEARPAHQREERPLHQDGTRAPLEGPAWSQILLGEPAGHRDQARPASAWPRTDA